MTEAAAAVISAGDMPMSELARMLARSYPEAPALELTIALASAAAAVESVFAPSGATAARAQAAWKQAALVAAEVHHLALMGRPHRRAADLLAHWPEN